MLILIVNAGFARALHLIMLTAYYFQYSKSLLSKMLYLVKSKKHINIGVWVYQNVTFEYNVMENTIFIL